MKKLLFGMFIMVLVSSFISAYSINIEFPNGNAFSAGSPIIFKTTVYDDSGKSIDAQVNVEIQDSEKKITNTIVTSTEIKTISLKDPVSSGQGVIKASFQDAQTIAFFEIGREELAQFELNGEKLIVKNIGNTPYARTIKITIGETTGTQTPNLGIGESISYRLIAPAGVYNIKVEDGISPSLIRGGIKLTGTGNVIGAVDDSASKRSGITGGVSPEEGDVALLSYLKNNKFVYVFVAVVFGAMILIAIERNYKRKISK
jgi:hypothetical protein